MRGEWADREGGAELREGRSGAGGGGGHALGPFEKPCPWGPSGESGESGAGGHALGPFKSFDRVSGHGAMGPWEGCMGGGGVGAWGHGAMGRVHGRGGGGCGWWEPWKGQAGSGQ